MLTEDICKTNAVNRAVVAMSGGVDSSVAALLLKQAGWDIVGVSLQVWDYSKGCSSKGVKTCCSPKDFQDARLVASKLEIPFYVFDVEREFEEGVIRKFINYYKSGYTPSPCIDCNVFVKFGELKRRADELGYPYIATGHYARIITLEEKKFLARGVDKHKDQSYFLFGIGSRLLNFCSFPLGELTKSQTREIAAAHGFVTATKKESQDLCFISGGVDAFLAEHSVVMPGVIRHISGRFLGFVDNIFVFTRGQRKGLRVAWQEPLYVLSVDTENRSVIVGERKFLETNVFTVNNWVSYIDQYPIEGIVQVRSRHSGFLARVEMLEERTVRILKLDDDKTVVTPGQAAVLYDKSNQIVLGGGEIVSVD